MSEQPGELTGQLKMDALGKRSSNANSVKAVEITGHGVGMMIIGSQVFKTGAAIYATKGLAAAACSAIPMAAGLAGVLGGVALANHFALDEKLLDWMGQPRLAAPGLQPATIDHAIAHGSHPFVGALGGLLVGAAIGFGIAAGLAAVFFSGGTAIPLLASAAIALTAGAGGGIAGSIINGLFSKSATPTGWIIEGSPDVYFEKRKAARVADEVSCNKHSTSPMIAEGSETIFINNQPLARIGHHTTCGATIQEGCKTIFADKTTKQYGKPDSELSVIEQFLVSGAEVALCVNALRLRNTKLGKWLFGDPVDPSDGSYVDNRTDLEYPGILPLKLTRTYSGRDTVEGLLGNKWICNWSQRLVYDPKEPTVNLEDGDGEILQFSLGTGPEFNSRNLKASHYHLTGTKQSARLFDSRSQQTLIFDTTEANSGIGRLTAIEDRNNNRIDFIYSGAHLSRVVHCDGTAFYVTTTAQGCIESITVEEGGRLQTLVRYSYNPSTGLTDITSLFAGEFHYGYTKEGWINHWHDSGATTVDLEYDTQGRVIATKTPDGMYNDRFAYYPEEKKTQYFDAEGGCTTHWFNDHDLLIREQDSLGNITTHEINGLDRKLSTTNALGRTTTFDYDTFGNLTGQTDWSGRGISLAYDKHGQLTQIDYPDGTKAFWKYDERGNLLEAEEPDGRTYHFTYDEHGRLISETGPDGASGSLTYDKAGRLASLSNALGQTTAFNLDRWGRPQQITDAAGHNTRYEYDLSPENPRAHVSRVIHPDGGEERFAYDKEGLPATHIAQEGQTTRYRHGAFDLLRNVIDPKGYNTTLDYDNAARLKRITNAQGQTWTYSYDLAGRLIHETDWAGRKTTYIRDAIGRVLTKRLPDGIEQHLTWDELDRIAAVVTKKQRITYEYDNSDRLIRAATWNKTSTEPENDLQFCYDDKDRLEKEIQNGITIEYKYDQSGRCISRTSPTGETSFEFDLLGQFKGMNSNGHMLDFDRNALGLETLRSYRNEESLSQSPVPSSQSLNAFSLKQTYDPCGRLTSQLAGQKSNYQSPAHERLAEINRKYKWDKSGRLVGVKDNKRGTSNYRYDVRDQVERIKRITGLNKQTEEQFDYDSLMNLALSKGQQHKYENGAIRTIGNSSYRYDMRGRVREKRVVKNGFRPKTWHYLWDDFDRLIETHTPDGSIWKYTYDAFGRRINKECTKAGGFTRQQATTYIWQGATLAEEITTNGDKTETTRWHFEPGTFIPLAKEVNGNFYPIVTDHLGTPKELFDANGNCVWRADNGLWGETEVSFAKKADNYQPLVDCSLRFQNQWEDEESGLYYNLNRYYDPDSGQYLSTDPIGLEGGIRTHGYVHDPMQWVDPLGLCKSAAPSGSLGPDGPGQFVMKDGGTLETSTVVRRGEFVNRMFDSRFGTTPNVSGPLGRSFSPGSGVPTTAAEGINQRGLSIYNTNNAQEAIIYRATKNIPATSRTALGGTSPEILIEPSDWPSLQPVTQYPVVPN